MCTGAGRGVTGGSRARSVRQTLQRLPHGPSRPPASNNHDMSCRTCVAFAPSRGLRWDMVGCPRPVLSCTRRRTMERSNAQGFGLRLILRGVDAVSTGRVVRRFLFRTSTVDMCVTHLHHGEAALVLDRVLARGVVHDERFGRGHCRLRECGHPHCGHARDPEVYGLGARVNRQPVLSLGMDGRAAPDWATFHDPSGKYTLKHQGAYPVVEVRVNQAGAQHPLSQQPPPCVCGMPTDARVLLVGCVSCDCRRRRPAQAAAKALRLGGDHGAAAAVVV